MSERKKAELTGCFPGFSSQVKVLFAGQDIDRSPFLVNVSKALGDPNKVQARGPGLEPVGNVANKPTYFDIYTAGEAKQNPRANPMSTHHCFIPDKLRTQYQNTIAIQTMLINDMVFNSANHKQQL